MSSWLIDITSFIRVVSDDKPTPVEAVDHIKEEIRQIIDNMHIEITPS